MIDVTIKLSRAGFNLDVSFSAGTGVTALFGPSGSGKSTILGAIAGLERPQQGLIRAGSEVFFDSDKGINLSPHHRNIGYVFQDAALFPHMSVARNLRYGSRNDSGFERIVALLGLQKLLERRPAKLSGGERQRVAIGRALLSNPRLVLMDEPLAALDTPRKQEILPYIESLNAEFQLPIIYVSHAVDEVARLADEVIVIEAGRIVSQGPPERALSPHESRFDRISILQGKAGAYDEVYGLTSLAHAAGAITIAARLEEGRDTKVVIRATDVTLASAAPQHLSMRTALQGHVAAIEVSSGPVAIVTVALAGGQMLAAAATRKAIDDLGLAQGSPVWCLIKAVSIDERWLNAT